MAGNIEHRRKWQREYYRKWRQKYPEKNRLYGKRWRDKNRDYYKAYQRIYQRGLPKDSRHRIASILRCRITAVLKGRSKVDSLDGFLGCSFAEFKIHIEGKFYDGMTWENHGSKWHLDHIKPCAVFNLSDPEEQRRCFHFTNLQPLTVEENMQKGKKYQHGIH